MNDDNKILNMNKNLQQKSSKELDLSYAFIITDFQNRHFVIELGKPLRKLDYSENYRNWFMEDLIYFLAQNRYQLRWDVAKIKFEKIENLGLSKENEKDFIEFLTTKISNFQILI